MSDKRPILFLTGLSGAGISTSLKALEDCGYEVFDNFPLAHVEALLLEKGFENTPIALGFDSRTRAYSPDRVIQMAHELNATLIYLTASDESIHKRFSETRRKHPMAKDRTVTDGITYEREWLSALPQAVDHTIDTSGLSVHDLKHIIETKFALDDKDKRLSVTVMSFGFKYGVPREVDMILDARFLKNPHWEPSLRAKTGKEVDIQNYIQTDERFDPFYNKVKDMADFLLPQYAREGKSYFTIAFGCTGGKHRSVYLTERLAKDLEKSDFKISIRHREIG